ncbi:uncharacterized protein LOC108671954 [Hyalella azteca]|uniref:Mitochondria-eating protein n=1 Tax=Hyalella azteca TaxID=294128 RepID=A0A8B7NMY4_HYAAZ|nr:uncharacterized protein LOC108671954 [Hyalella azteca]
MEASLRVNYFNSTMANPMAPSGPSLSRLNRYFDVHPPPHAPQYHTRTGRPTPRTGGPRTNNCCGDTCSKKPCSASKSCTLPPRAPGHNSSGHQYDTNSSNTNILDIPKSKNLGSGSCCCSNSNCCVGPASVSGPAIKCSIDGAACKTSTWTYKHVSPKNGGVTIIEKGSRVRPDKQARRPLTKLNWRNSPKSKGFTPSKDYLDLDTRPHFSAASSEVSPRLAVKRVTLLASHQQFRDAAEFIHRLPGVTVRSALTDLPMDTLVEAMPLSLPVIEAIYCTAGEVSAEVLHVERVVWQMVRFFAQQEECLTGDIRWEFCGPFVNLCRDVLRVVAKIQPSLRRTLLHRRRQLERAIEGMGHHGLVGTSDESLTSLHDALKLEFEKVVKSYTAALATLQELGTGNKGHNISKGPAPIQASHQRQLSIAPQDIQERLIKNKSLLNIVEPTLGNHSLDILLGILQRRIEHDKDALFQFTQLRKEAKDIPADAVVAPIIMRYAHGCDQVLEMLREALEETGYDLMADDDEGSDVSGYHSDSDSTIMMSGNSPYITKHARFNFLTRSVRDRSHVGTRMALPMSGSTIASSALSSSALSSSQTSSGPSCASSAVGSDTQSQPGSDGGRVHESAAKGPSPSDPRGADDAQSILKAPSEAPSGVSTLADTGGSQSELEALRRELSQARQTIRLMHEREKEYRDRLSERSNGLLGEAPARVRVTYTNNLNSSNENENKNPNKVNIANKYSNEEKLTAHGNNFLRRKENARRDFGRSRSVVDLVEETSTCSHMNKSWAQTYSREYPKGYLNKDLKQRLQNSSKDIYAEPPTGTRVEIKQHLPSTATTFKSQELDAGCENKRNADENFTICDNNKLSDVSGANFEQTRLPAARGSNFDIRRMSTEHVTNSDNQRTSAQQRTNFDRKRTVPPQGTNKANIKRTSVGLEANLSGRLDNLALGDHRPTALVRRYANLYTQTRVETLDALDQLTEMRNAPELKSKLLFSVVVLAFRSTTATASALRQDVRKILQVPSSNNPAFPPSIVSALRSPGLLPDSKSGHPDSPVALANSVKGLAAGGDLSALEAAMASVITANVDSHDLTQNVEDVCHQIWATLYDYPGLKTCEGLLRYVKDCVRVAWGLVNQSPPYCIEYESRAYNDNLHVRFHTSDPDTTTIHTYLWPALTEGVSGPCVQKGVVIT